MPYEIIWEPEGVLVTFSGRVTARDLINSPSAARSWLDK